MVKKVIPKEVLSKEAKVKRVDTNLKHKRAPSKSELEVNVKINNQPMMLLKRQKIKHLKSKINNLEQQIEYLSCKEIMHCKETQTEAGLNSKCDECNFEGENQRELGWHMGRIHGWPSFYFQSLPAVC